MKDKLLLLAGATLSLTYFSDQTYATCVEVSPSSERHNYVRFVPASSTASSQVNGIVIELGREEEFETNLNLLKSISFDMDLAEQADIEKKLTKLQTHASLISCLDVSDNFLDNSTLKLLSPFIGLRKLNLANNRFDDNGLKAIGLLSKITDLSLYHNKITANAIRMLENLKELTTLDVSCTLMGASGMKAIQETFPYLISLQIRGCELDDQSLEHVLAMSNLKKIDISSNRFLSSNAVQAFNKKAAEKGLVVVSD